MTDDLDRMLTLIEEQAPAFFVVGDEGYEGHVVSCVGGTVVAVARRAGTHEKRREYRWRYEQLNDFGPAELPAEEPEDEDPMMQMGRELAARAREDSGLSLAERLLRNPERRTDGNGS